MDNVHSTCSSIGGDGFAFVIQNDSIDSLGKQGMGLGYDGIRNALAVEFDTYYNFETLDVYRNHVSVHTGGQYQISSNHSHSIAHTNAVPMLTEGEIVARIRYVPFLSAETLTSETFSPYFQRGDFESGSKSNWYDPGLGALSIFIQDLNTPVLSVPLHIPGTLDLDNGRAWIGFTAATGEETYQSHDILSFSFSSLRMDRNDNFLVKRHVHVHSKNSYGSHGDDNSF